MGRRCATPLRARGMQRDPERVSLHGGKTNPDARVCDRASGKGGVQWEYTAQSVVRRPRPYGGMWPQS